MSAHTLSHLAWTGPTTNDRRLKKEITQHVFIHLIKQSDAVLNSEDEESERKERRKGEIVGK